MPYELTETTLTATFLLIWAFIGLTMLRDQLLTIRRQRLEESSADPPSSVARPPKRLTLSRRKEAARC